MKPDQKKSQEDIFRVYIFLDGKNHEQYKKNVPQCPFRKWKESHYLPVGWLGKDKKVGKKFLISENGERFSSYRSAVEFMKLNQKYSEQDLSRVYHFPDGRNHELNYSSDCKPYTMKFEVCLKRNKMYATLKQSTVNKKTIHMFGDRSKSSTKESTLDNVLVGLDITVLKVTKQLCEEKSTL